ncbi:hypothetical protein FHL15_005781 [Xylaria flabelliformis]|uniref:Uncharacterized protein n=1 Tax=Xylaria flabelliformis TaxID=2512241 RepID=A0A553HZ23_9PEZI|nr:hypothetical protein FHL15_005781 [Xylaria flabelliformis]
MELNDKDDAYEERLRCRSASRERCLSGCEYKDPGWSKYWDLLPESDNVSGLTDSFSTEADDAIKAWIDVLPQESQARQDKNAPKKNAPKKNAPLHSDATNAVVESLTNMARHDTSRSKADWLPYQGTRTLPTKAVHGRYIVGHKDSDWFVQLAHVMDNTTPKTVQSKMFLKFYIFIRDFMPQGLVDNLAHIKGQDVMDHLLCHAEYAPSRHKVSKAANQAFTELEKWMGDHSHWRSSLNQAKTEPKTREGGERKDWKAPGLHSPAGLLALLVIAHPNPDSPYREWIGRLEIDWMMLQPRGTLNVQHGFWKGVNANNVYDIFSAEEARQPKISSLVSYTDLFQNFEQARKDIRPSQAKVSAQQIVETAVLKSHLHPDPDTTKGVTELKAWLLGKLADSQRDDSLHQWCRHWEGRVDAVLNFEEQVIVQSLFVQSLRRLVSFDSTPAARSYMLLDMDEAELQPERTFAEEEMSKLRQALETVTYYRPCREVNNKLLVAGNHHQAMKETINELWAQQAYLFLQILRETVVYHADWKSVMILEAQRTRVVLDSFLDTHTPKNNKPWYGKKDVIWNEETIKILKLTRWQLRALVAPGAFGILTDWQARVFHQKFCRDHSEPTKKNTANSINPSSIDLSSIDLSLYKVMSVVKNDVFTVEEHESLYKLFGNLCKPWPLTIIKPYVFTQGPTEEGMSELAQPSAKPMSIPASPSPTAAVHKVAQDLTPATARADEAQLDKPHLVAPPTTLEERVNLIGWKNSQSSLEREAFIGKKSKKRAASPDHRHSKAIKLDFTLEELSKERQLFREEVQAEMRTAREELHALMTSNTKGLQDRIQDVIEATENEAVAIKSVVDASVQVIEGIVKTKQHNELLLQVQQAQAQLEDISVEKVFELQNKLHRQTQAQAEEHQIELRTMQEDVKKIRMLMEKPPQATSQDYPAPRAPSKSTANFVIRPTLLFHGLETLSILGTPFSMGDLARWRFNPLYQPESLEAKTVFDVNVDVNVMPLSYYSLVCYKVE